MENNCCENKEKMNCGHGVNSCCMKKCHMMKKLLILVFIIIAFCMGTQWGEMRSYSRGSNYGRGMMWGNGFEARFDKTIAPIDEAKVESNKEVVAPKQ